MKVKGSITIEAAVIVPLFVIMVVNIILLAFECHDRAVINCASDKICMEVEFDSKNNDEYKNKIAALEEKGRKYLLNKTIIRTGELKIESGMLDVSSDYSKILKNNPMEFVRFTDAAEKLIGKE